MNGNTLENASVTDARGEFLDLCIEELRSPEQIRSALTGLVNQCGSAELRCKLSPEDRDGCVYRFEWGDNKETKEAEAGGGRAREIAELICSNWNNLPLETRIVEARRIREQTLTFLNA